MERAIRTIVSRSTGSRRWKLNWPAMPHILLERLRDEGKGLMFPGVLSSSVIARRATRFVQVKREASEHLCLAPAMHGNVVPTEV
jgi:hypothetical protein